MRFLLTLILSCTLLSCNLVFADTTSFLQNVGRSMAQMLLFTGTLDVNATTGTSASSTAFQIGGFSLVGLFATNSSGTFSSAVIEIEGSPDGSEWFSLVPAVTLTGEGMVVATSVPFRYVRARVTSAEGSAGEASIYMQAK